VLLRADPQHQCYYQEELAHYLKNFCIFLFFLGKNRYSALLRVDPQHQCYYQKELALYLHKHLDKNVARYSLYSLYWYKSTKTDPEALRASYNPDVDLDAYFKEVLSLLALLAQKHKY
jgi:hypothetical protein